MSKQKRKRKCPYCHTYTMEYCCDILPRSLDTHTMYEYYICMNSGCGHYHIVSG